MFISLKSVIMVVIDLCGWLESIQILLEVVFGDGLVFLLKVRLLLDCTLEIEMEQHCSLNARWLSSVVD